MNREILFRGKRLDNGDWEHGYYAYYGYTDNMKHYIIPDHASTLYAREVDPDTVGQYTGLKDKNGVMIFEGDILEAHIDNSDSEYTARNEVKWLELGWHLFDAVDKDAFEMITAEEGFWTIRGNVWDNPELLKVI